VYALATAVAACLALAVPAVAAAAVPAERLAPLDLGVEAPLAVAVAPDGTVFVAEASRNRVLVLDASGARRAELGGIDRPISLALDAAGRLLVGSAGSGSVVRYGPDLAPAGALGRGAGEFRQPGGIAAAADGTVFVADSRADAVLAYGADGALLGPLGGDAEGAPLFEFPTAVAIDRETGALVVADLPRVDGTKTARIRAFTAEGTAIRSYGGFGRGEGLLVKPLGVATDGAGRVYAGDAFQNVVQVFGRDGAWLGVVHDPEHPMRTPVGVAVAPGGGRLLVASLTAGRVDVFALHWPAQTATLAVTVAGEGTGAVTSDPPGIACPGACSAAFPAGSEVALAAVPAPGSILAAWGGDCTGGGACTLTMAGGRAVTATFARGARPGASPADFDGDGRSDLLVRDRATGEVAVWLVGEGLRAVVAPVGRVRGTRDCAVAEADGDGRADVLWRDRRSGRATVWTMDGARVAARVRLAARRDPRWELAAYADFDGDRRADLLWRHRVTGAVALWIMDGPRPVRRRVIGRMGPARWAAAAAADFTGDGRADVLWHDRRRGALALWAMNGDARPARTALGSVPDPGRRLAGAGDFDGDGTADLLWRRGDGAPFTLWTVREGTVRSERPLVVDAGAGWALRELGDYDGDGRADLLLQRADGGPRLACLGDGAGAAHCRPLEAGAATAGTDAE